LVTAPANYFSTLLENDYAIWKRNKGSNVKLNWAREGDERLFQILEQHRRLSKRKNLSNWLYFFRDSVDLKEMVYKHFQASSGQEILRELINRGRVGFLIPEVRKWSVSDQQRLTLDISVANAGNTAAIQPVLSLYADNIEEHQRFGTLLPGERAMLSTSGLLSAREFQSQNPVLLIRATFATPDGHLVADDTNLELAWQVVGDQTEVAVCDYGRKRYIHSSAIRVKSGEFDE
jgi:hypothetical protein